jgi:hypothetical protein
MNLPAACVTAEAILADHGASALDRLVGDFRPYMAPKAANSLGAHLAARLGAYSADRRQSDPTANATFTASVRVPSI